MRLTFDSKDGHRYLAKAVNVDIDQTGGIRTRRGYTKTAVTSPVHSLWADESQSWCFFVQDQTLFRVYPGMTTTAVRTGLTPGQPMSYCVHQDRVFYTNGFQNGVVSEGVSAPWAVVDQDGRDRIRFLDSPPVGKLLASYAGRVWIARDNVIWFTEPFDPYSCSIAENFFMTEGEVTMLLPLETGMFVGTTRGVWFIDGRDPASMDIEKASNDKPIKNTARAVTGDVLSKALANDVDAKFTKPVGIWLSDSGICVGMQDGTVRNLTQRAVRVPELSGSGGALFQFDDRIIATAEVSDVN